jgi:tetratricopeptide (TPR) repeat protein
MHERQQRVLASCFVLLGLGGCEPQGSRPPSTLPEARASSVSQRTTDGGVALRNLSAQIEEQLRQLDKRPKDSALRAAAVGNLLARTQFTGTYRDFDVVQLLVGDYVEQTPDQAEGYALRASYFGATHLFSSALGIWRVLRSAAVRAVRSAPRFEIATAGDLIWAKHVRQTAAERAPTFKTVGDWAVAEAALGEFAKADELFQQALSLYRDVSPFPVAWIMFQRGVMWAERANRPELAAPLYRESVYRLPGFVAANVHLAELEWGSGDQESALARLRELARHTEEPEPSAVLAKFLNEAGSPEATAYAERARSLYEALLQDYPEAFWDHAAEFLMNAGADAPRALELARLNLALRPTGRAYQVAIRASLAANDAEGACELMASAAERDRHDRNLDALVAIEGLRCH